MSPSPGKRRFVETVSDACGNYMSLPGLSKHKMYGYGWQDVLVVGHRMPIIKSTKTMTQKHKRDVMHLKRVRRSKHR